MKKNGSNKKGLIIAICSVALAVIVAVVVVIAILIRKEDTPTHEHVWITDEAVAPTCAQTGLTEGKHCRDCSVVVPQEEVEKLPHTVSEWLTDSEPTCKEEGEKHKECTICGEILDTEKIAVVSHTPSDWLTDKEPTCKEEGDKHIECIVCKEILDTGKIEVLVHISSEWIIDKQPTCTQEGEEHKECTVCGEILAEDKIAVIPHTAGEWEETKAPTLELEGERVKKCIVCQEVVESAVIPTLQHVLIFHEGKAPTCTQSGYKAYYTCQNCDYTTYEYLSELKHNYEQDIKHPNCTEGGYTLHVCSRCGDNYKTDEKEKLNHNHVGAVTTQPTCKDFGEKTFTCTRCGDKYKTQVEKLEHTPSEWLTDKEPSCTVEGDKHIECTVCGETLDTGKIDIIDHTPSEWLTDKEPSCTVEGDKHIECTVCGKPLETGKIDIIPHTPSEWLTDKEPSCTVEGDKHIECTACGKPLETGKIDIIDHTPSEWLTDKEPSCTVEGDKHIECTVCGKPLETGKIEIIDHTPSDWIIDRHTSCKQAGEKHKECTGCGEPLETEEITILPHTPSEWLTDKEPSCTVEGDKHIECTVCGKPLETGKIEIIDHTPSEWLTDKEPSCTVEGDKHIECTVCRETLDTGKIDIIDHTPSDWIIDRHTSCKQAGEKHKECTVCEKPLETGTIDKLPHTPSEWIIDKHTSCEGAGEKHKECTVCETPLATEDIPQLPHTPSEWLTKVEAKCETLGSEIKECTACHTELEFREVEELGHDYECVHNPVESCTQEGKKTYTCKRDATHTYEETFEKLPHEYEYGACKYCNKAEPIEEYYTRVNEDGTVNANGEYIYFGTYPQTKVADSQLISELDTKAGTKPNSSNGYEWTSYGYYKGTGNTGTESNTTSYMWYQDITHNGIKYRGVYFTSYRPYYTYYTNSSSNSYQDDNGYSYYTTYWFAYEPIMWRILKEETLNEVKYATILCEMLIDSQEYYYSKNSHTVEEQTVYANNYAYSTIRAWLNDNFYNTAFNALQKSLVQAIMVDNSPSSTTSNYNDYACENTVDKVWLLSYQDVINTEYGFSSNYSSYNSARQKKLTDYAKSQGGNSSSDSSYAGNSGWWLRSPYDSDNYRTQSVGYNGYCGGSSGTYYTYVGVCPALKIRLQGGMPHEHTPSEWLTDNAATCTSTGDKHIECTICKELLAIGTIDMLPHTESDFITDTAPKCESTGKGHKECTVCRKWLTSSIVIDALGHDYACVHDPVETCTQKGLKTYTCKNDATHTYTEEIPKLAHNYVNGGACSSCGAMEYKLTDGFARINLNGTPNANGEYILFGFYPQSLVKDTSLENILTTTAGTLPSNGSDQQWTSYGYYQYAGYDLLPTNTNAYMWYQDITYNGVQYRGVYSTKIRGSHTNASLSSVSDSAVYWFKYEPILWRILSEDNSSGETQVMIFSELAIDSQAYQNTYTYQYEYLDRYSYNHYYNNNTGVPNKTYANNYMYSTIRAWLNDNFYNTAFTDLQKSLILATTVDNGRYTTSGGQELGTFACANTVDNVWLLSWADVTNSAYGFSRTARRKQATDYAKEQGISVYTTSGIIEGNCYWWTRSPYHEYGSKYNNENQVERVDYYGDIYSGGVSYYDGICPAVRIKLVEPEVTYTRVNADGAEDENGDYVLFGSYPQTEVTDTTLTSALTSKAGTKPVNGSNYNWTSYKYYISGSNTTDYMWYQDVEYNGEEYRGVYFTSWRPYYTTYSSSASSTYQDNRYSLSTIYWFKYEPILWRILEEEGGYATVLCEMLIDSQEYYHSTSSRTINGSTVYANNYWYSNIRTWLNETFYNTAFESTQQALIQAVTLDNSASTTGAVDWNNGVNSYAVSNTSERATDNVWLLSYKDVLNTNYGFSSSYSTNDTMRQKKTTDYAQAQGCWTSTSASYAGNGCWWLRSPYYKYSHNAQFVNNGGDAINLSNVNCTYYGVCPALKIKLS